MLALRLIAGRGKAGAIYGRERAILTGEHTMIRYETEPRSLNNELILKISKNIPFYIENELYNEI